jgi:hypothetical protein
MIQHLQLPGDLKIGQHKSISCVAQLKIDIHYDDDWAEPDPNYDPSKYIDGVCIAGKFGFDTSPIGWMDKHPVKPNVVGELTLRDGKENSKFNILITEKSEESYVVPKKIKRYFWQFFAIGKPIWDELDIFPKDYQGLNMNRLFACTNFRGYWPVSVASVVVASDKQEAKTLLLQKLKEQNIIVEVDLELTEISLKEKSAVLLNDGDWK